MQTIGLLTATVTGTVYHQPNPARPSKWSEQKKTDYGAQWCRNAFLKTTISPIAPQTVTRQWGNEAYNYITKENYDYLLKSAMRYASLSGIELKHQPGRSIGEGISNVYDELDRLIGEINLNIETHEDKLEFVLWKYHPWGDYTFYWLPVKFTESLHPKLKRIAITFIHCFMHSNGLITTNTSFDVGWILDWAKDGLSECEPDDRKKHQKLIDAYESGKIFRLMERIDTKCYYRNLPETLDRYVPGNEFEGQLIDLFKEGLAFIGKDKPSIMSYGYDPLDDEDREYHPVEMERMIRIVYDPDDFVSEWMMDWANDELRESYDISPATRFAISPHTTELFTMDQYPDHFFKWFNKLCTLIS